MGKHSDIDTRISRACTLANTTTKDMEEQGRTLLELFRDARRNNTDAAIELHDELCSYSEETDADRKMNEAMVRLEFFASENSRRRYEERIESVLDTGWMIRIMDLLRDWVYNFPDYGPEFVTILNLCYMSSFTYTELDIMEELGISRGNYYKKKKRAITLFGLAFESYRIGCRPQQFYDTGAGYRGEQLRFEFAL